MHNLALIQGYFAHSQGTFIMTLAFTFSKRMYKEGARHV